MSVSLESREPRTSRAGSTSQAWQRASELRIAARLHLPFAQQQAVEQRCSAGATPVTSPLLKTQQKPCFLLKLKVLKFTQETSENT